MTVCDVKDQTIDMMWYAHILLINGTQVCELVSVTHTQRDVFCS